MPALPSCRFFMPSYFLQAGTLPQCWQDFVRTCFRLPAAKDGTAALLADDFFRLSVRAAYFFLSSLQSQSREGGKSLHIATELCSVQASSDAGPQVLTLCDHRLQCRLAKRRFARFSSGPCARQ